MKVGIKQSIALAVALVTAGSSMASADGHHGRGRDHRRGPPIVVVRPPVVVVRPPVVVVRPPVILVPNIAPPALRVERIGRPRHGMVWIDGRWDWRNGQWVWAAGRWERRQHDHRWHRGEWVQRGDRYELSGDTWEDAPAYPTAAPPAAQPEAMPAPRTGFVWVTGNYGWTDGQYEWTAGHWERQKAAQAWIPGQWTQGSDRWVWVDGHWQ